MTRSHQKLAPDYPIFKVTILAAVPTIVTPIDKQRRAHLLDFLIGVKKADMVHTFQLILIGCRVIEAKKCLNALQCRSQICLNMLTTNLLNENNHYHHQSPSASASLSFSSSFVTTMGELLFSVYSSQEGFTARQGGVAL